MNTTFIIQAKKADELKIKFYVKLYYVALIYKLKINVVQDSILIM